MLARFREAGCSEDDTGRLQAKRASTLHQRVIPLAVQAPEPLLFSEPLVLTTVNEGTSPAGARLSKH